MPGKSDIEEPPETILLISNKSQKIFNNCLKIHLSNTQTEFIDQSIILKISSVIQPNIIIQNFDSFAEKPLKI